MLLAVVAVERGLDAVFVCVDVAIRIVGVALRYHTSLQQLYHTAAAIVKVGFGIFCAFLSNTSNRRCCATIMSLWTVRCLHCEIYAMLLGRKHGVSRWALLILKHFTFVQRILLAHISPAFCRRKLFAKSQRK